MPSADEMYPPGFDTYVEVKTITEGLEGAHRPGHFRGVTTIVAKLFAIVQPDRAYFGQKDAQQLKVIQKMTEDLAFGVEVVPCETIREDDGLAMSSRNDYLDPEERKASLALFRALVHAQHLYREGERSGEVLRQQMREIIEGEDRANIDYVSIADRDTLQEIDCIHRGALASLAVYIGKTRLIDNIILSED
jgi:pantoate--beta-alanine ligase